MTNRTRLDSLMVGERFTLPGGRSSMRVIDPDPELPGKVMARVQFDQRVLAFNGDRYVVPLDPPPPVPVEPLEPDYGRLGGQWTVRKRADQIMPGDRFIFDDALGGEGETVTAVGIGIYMGTISVSTEELDFELNMTDKTFVTIAPEEEQ